MFFACNEDDPTPAEPTGAVFVTVRFNNQIVSGAQISTEPETITSETDLTGTALLNEIPVGGYKVNATHPNIGSGAVSVSVKAEEVSDVFINLIGGIFENPSVSFQTPISGQVFSLGANVDFVAIVNDSEDAANSLSLEWSSDVDGVLSTTQASNNGQANLSISTLSEGEHTITLKATDSDDLEGMASINITIKRLPDAVTLQPITVSSGGLVLNWSSSEEEEFFTYRVTRSENAFGPFNVIQVISDVNETSFQDVNVSFGIQYYYQVVVVVTNGDESPSNVESSLYEGENINVGVSVERIKIDPVRPYIYALDKINNSLLFINKDEKIVEKTIFVGSSPSDMSITLDNSKMYIANYGSTQIAVVDLETQEKINDLTVDANAGTWNGNPYRIACIGNDRFAFTSEDQWNNIKLANANTGAIIQTTGSVYQPGLITTPDHSKLFVTESGSSGSQAIRYNINGNSLTEVDESSSETNYSTRDACMSGDGTYLFYNRKKLLVNNLQSNLGEFTEGIFAANFDGSIAVGEENIWNSNTFSIIRALPVSSRVMALDSDDETLFIYDDNTSKIYIIKIN